MWLGWWLVIRPELFGFSYFFAPLIGVGKNNKDKHWYEFMVGAVVR